MSGTTVDQADWQRERLWLGYAGLLPFVGATLVLLFSDTPAWRGSAADTLLAYAALIASFLGAVHWGLAGCESGRLGRARLRWGVAPALLAWTLLALPVVYALAGFAALFGLILWVDRYLLPVRDAAYQALRLRLSGAVIALLVAATLGAAGGVS